MTSEKIQDGQVLNADLASGAVTDAKISGVISATKLPVGTTAGTVAAGNHNHDNLYQKKYANVVVVAKSGGDFTDPIAAINSITDASATNPYLLKIMPGIYDIGTGSVSMKRFVDIEGAGENTTTITGTVPGEATGVIRGASDAELRLLSTENRIVSSNCNDGVAIYLDNASPRIRFVSVLASVRSTYGIYIASGASPYLENVTVNCWGQIGIEIIDSSPVVSNCMVNVFDGADATLAVDIRGASSPLIRDTQLLSTNLDSGSYGVWVWGGSPVFSRVNVRVIGNYGLILGGIGTDVVIEQSSIQGGLSWVADTIGGYSVKIASSKLVGLNEAVFGTWTCAGDYDVNFASVGNNCR